MDIDVWVTTLKGKVLYHKRAAEHGKFTFETPALPRDRQESDDYDYGGEDSEEEDTYRVCLEHQQNPSRSHPTGTKRAIMFKLNQSFNGGTQRSETAAKTSDTDRLQESMQSMHRTLSGMIGDLSKLQMRDKALTARLVKTGRRVSGMAIFSLIVTLGISALQFRYYRGYFKQKKLC